MTDREHPNNGRNAALSRLAALQRLREDAEKGHKAAMLESINKLIEAEVRAMRAKQESQ